MPIYAYRCEHCGHAKDVLQKVSDPVLTVCPACGESTFRKQVTAAGFQLKGSGWYVTDFRGDKPGKRDAEANDGVDGKGTGGEQAPAPKGAEGAAPVAADGKAAEGKAAETPKSAPAAASSPAPAATPASPAASSSGSSSSGSSGSGSSGGGSSGGGRQG